MRVLIFEDEKYTATHLINLLGEIDPDINVVKVIGTVKEGIEWYGKNNMPDLIFQDVMLSDGNCFDIFDKVEITVPVIFTTAYSEYALRSFQVNSIYYIVKPYDKRDIKDALRKFEKMKSSFTPPGKVLLDEVLNKKALIPKRRFLIKSGDNFLVVNSPDIAYLISEDSVTMAVLFTGKKHIVDQSIAEFSNQMDSDIFFRINRKAIVNIHSVAKISTWFNSRLKLQLNPPVGEDIVVSRERVKDFKTWLGR